MWQYVAFHPQITITITEELKTSLLFFFENFFLVFIRDFSPLSGFNTASRPQYIAIPLSFDNTRKNLLARIEIPKKSKIIAPYCLLGAKGNLLNLQSIIWTDSALKSSGAFDQKMNEQNYAGF